MHIDSIEFRLLVRAATVSMKLRHLLGMYEFMSRRNSCKTFYGLYSGIQQIYDEHVKKFLTAILISAKFLSFRRFSLAGFALELWLYKLYLGA